MWSWDMSTARWTCGMGREPRRQAGSRWRGRQDFWRVFSLHSWVTFLKKSNQEATPGDSLIFSFLVHFCNFVSGTDFHQTLFFFKLCIYFWRWWVCTRASLVSVSEGDSWLWTTGSRVLGLQQLRHTGSVAAMHSLSCSRACEVFPDWGSNLSPQHCQGDSQPLYHQGSPSGCLSSVLLLYLLAVKGFLCQALYLSP